MRFRVLIVGIAGAALVSACTPETRPESGESTVTEAAASSSLTETTEGAGPVTTSTVQTIDPSLIEDAVASVESLFAAYNAGDEAAVVELFTSDVTIADNIVGTWSFEEWSQLLAWNAAQGTVFSAHECSDPEVDDGLSVKLTCKTGNMDAPTQAVGAPAVPTVVRATVTGEGISQLRFGYGSPDFTHVNGPFAAWLEAAHADIAASQAFGFGNWTTVEQARENGRLTAELAADWATYLEQNDCTYLDGC